MVNFSGNFFKKAGALIAFVAIISIFPIDCFATGASILVLVNSSTNRDIQTMGNPTIIDLSKVGRALNIRVKAQYNGVAPYKVEFFVNGAYVRTENSAPFCLAGDKQGDYNNWNPKPGDYVIRTKKYFSNTDFVWDTSCNVRVVSKTVDFKGLYFTLINARTNRDLFELTDNDTISLSNVGNSLNIRADFLGGFVPDYVTFDLNNGAYFRQESAAPFAMAGDKQGDYLEWRPNPGSYTLTTKACIPGLCRINTLRFRVVK